MDPRPEPLAPGRTQPKANRDDALAQTTAVLKAADIRRTIRRQAISKFSRIIIWSTRGA
jgi:hypothetical protein